MASLPTPTRAHNFSAGPAQLPLSVLQKVQTELLSFQDSGMSIMEVSHRGPIFEAVLAKAQDDLRQLLNIPANYKILFLQGGGTGQFAAIPLNFINEEYKEYTTDYIVTGIWSAKAAEEAAKYAKVHIAANTKDNKHTTLPQQIQYSPNPAYVYYCANETVHGVEFPSIPEVPQGVPLIADFSSSFMSHPIDVTKYGVIIAGAQKNVGPSGVTIVIIRDDLIRTPAKVCPSVLDFKQMAKNDSMLNTPPTFNIYVTGLVFEWIKEMGGLEAVQALNAKKAAELYGTIDKSEGFYSCPVHVSCRSKMNVPFRIAGGNDALEKEFIRLAEKENFIGLAGHRSVGGLRASLYNAVSLESVMMLTEFMRKFQAEHASKL